MVTHVSDYTLTTQACKGQDGYRSNNIYIYIYLIQAFRDDHTSLNS